MSESLVCRPVCGNRSPHPRVIARAIHGLAVSVLLLATPAAAQHRNIDVKESVPAPCPDPPVTILAVENRR